MSNQLKLNYLSSPLVDVGVKIENTSHSDIHSLQGSILNLKQDFVSKAKKQGYQMRSIEDCLYALFAYLDEIIITKSKFALEWFDSRLMVTEFQEPNAGETFYTRAQTVSERNDKDTLEVFITCMLSGFLGKYQIEGKEAQKSVLDAFIAQTSIEEKLTSVTLSPAGNVDVGPLPTERTGKSILMISLVFLILCMGFYGVLVYLVQFT